MLPIVGTVRPPSERLAEPGCRSSSYAVDVLDPGLVRVTETWDGRAALDAHFASAHLAEWRAAWAGLGLHGRDLALHEVAAALPI